MPPESQVLQIAILAVIGLALTLYILLGGADFGGGVWDLFASGPTKAGQRDLIEHAIAPVWEANHVWLIFVLVAVLTGFPGLFGVLGVAFYLPLTIAALGIVLRGAAFVFKSYADGASAWQRAWTRVFGIASLITPFVLGAAGASLSTGRIRIVDGQVEAGLWSSWLSPLSIVTGLLTLAMCAYLAATYLTVEALDRGEEQLEEVFRRRALAAGIVAGAIAGLGLLLVRADAPLLWEGMLERGWPFVALSAAAGAGSLLANYRRRYAVARIVSAVAVGAVLWGWGAAMWPYFILPDLLVSEVAAPESSLRAAVVGFSIGGLLLLPSLLLLFRVFKTARPVPKE